MLDPIVVIDIDGVLADFSLAFTRRLVTMGLIEKPVPCAEQKTWRFRDSLPITRADEDAVWAKIDTSRSFWFLLPSLVGEVDRVTLTALRREAHIVYMTGRQDAGNRTYAQTKAWLQAYSLPSGSLVMQGDKAQGVAALGDSVIGVIDDKPSELESLRDAGAPVLACARPYNAHVEGVPRVASVGEFAEEMLSRLT